MRQRGADTTAAIAEWADDFTVPLDDALSLLVSSESVDPHRLAEQAVGVAKTAGVILCLCSTSAVAAARTAAPHTEEPVAAADTGHS
ncbi:unnamed protein product [Boreogadus saida]